MGLITPCPVEFSFSLISATNPEKIGASKLVPPATVRFVVLASRNPCEQLPVMPMLGSLEQYKNPALFGDPLREMSGTRRKVPVGMPGTPDCQLGLGESALMPPPPELKTAGLLPLGGASSFQTCSGMYVRAELITSVPLAGCQNVAGGVVQVEELQTSALRNSVPPIAVTYWLLAGKSTATACC